MLWFQCQLMMYSNVIVGITISRGSFVFSQSRAKVCASLTNVESLADGAFDLLCFSLSVLVDWDSAQLKHSNYSNILEKF